MIIYFDLYLIVNIIRGLRFWVLYFELLVFFKFIMSFFNCNIWGYVLRGFFFFLVLLVFNLFVFIWSVVLMKIFYYIVIWMNLKIFEGLLVCWMKLSNNLCVWILWVVFLKNNNKDLRLYFICFGKYFCLDKIF